MLPEEKIELDLDRNRIKTILEETYKEISNLLKIQFNISSSDFVSKIMPYLESNRVSIPVFLDLPSDDFPEMKIEVNLRRKKVFARMRSKKKQALVNHYLNGL